MDRNTLIAYALKYKGDYRYIERAVKRNEEIIPVECKTSCLTFFDEEYPKEFLPLSEPPYVLFYKGDLSLLKEEKIAVVGSRDPCAYAVKATACLCRHYRDTVVVSGLAKGIDGIAHEFSGRSIGILGCGIDEIYPRENEKLYRKLEKEGLILSEYPGRVKPLGCHFPFRNRLISALGERVYIMQSSRRSGTMSTLKEALDLGKEVRVLPYDLFSKEGENNNLLIYEGASPISCEEIAF